MSEKVGEKIRVLVWWGDARMFSQTVLRTIRLHAGKKCIIYQKRYIPLSFHRVGLPSACLDDAIGDVQ